MKLWVLVGWREGCKPGKAQSWKHVWDVQACLYLKSSQITTHCLCQLCSGGKAADSYGLMGWSLDPLPCPMPTRVSWNWLQAAGTQGPRRDPPSDEANA